MTAKSEKTGTITNKIAEALKHDIIYGKIRGGAEIVEVKIAERFHASNIPVREALRILEGQGFIIHRKFSGYTVREINPEEMIELYDIVRYLTSQLLSNGIPRYTELTYHRFRVLVEEIEKSKDTDHTVFLFREFAEVEYRGVEPLTFRLPV
jgi:DNA-binding GntR family transcriptional regulator